MKKISHSLILFFSFVLSQTAMGYGPEGHQIVGFVADHWLQGTRAREEVDKLLKEGETLASVSTWADQIKGGAFDEESTDFISNHPEHSTYHYSDVPFQFTHYQMEGVGARPRDIEHMMMYCITVLRSYSATNFPKPTHLVESLSSTNDITDTTSSTGTNSIFTSTTNMAEVDTTNSINTNTVFASTTNMAEITYFTNNVVDMTNTMDATNSINLTPRVALMLLTHYIGDMHQPLHIGCGYVAPGTGGGQFTDPTQSVLQEAECDQGGNFLKFNDTNLHYFWDIVAVQGTMKQAGKEGAASEQYATLLSALVPTQADWETTGDVIAWPIKWADSMLPIAAEAYRGIELVKRKRVKEKRHGLDATHSEWTIKLPPGYETQAQEVVKGQLARGGYRLAQLLKAIWPDS